MSKLFQVMVLGTGSHVGKSLVAAGLCRILSDRGYQVAPFKAQNMALNSAVADDGAEIGRAQWLQALSARTRSQAAMNPVLLKPVRGQGSQVVVLGQSQGIMSTRAYFRYWPKAAAQAQAAYKQLAGSFEALVMEGAGSPAEVNLAHRDLANLETARFSRAPWVLVVDIERGGSFASIHGTLALIPAWLRRRCLGVVFNKFRGDVRLMRSGLAWLRARGIRPLGVLPYLSGLRLEEEDSLGIPLNATAKNSKKTLNIDVIRYPFMANFNDALAVCQHPDIHVRWVRPGEQRSRPDLVLLPGSKDTLADLEVLRASGELSQLQAWRSQGTWTLGLCGGFQMLGSRIVDSKGSDSGRSKGRAEGLGALDAVTRMGAKKVLLSRDIEAQTPWGKLRLQGYEIHHGQTRLGPATKVFARDAKGAPLICQSKDGRVWGSYLHGLLDHAGFADPFLSRLARASRKRFRGLGPGLAVQREQSLQAWAAHMTKHLDLSFLPPKRRA